jgi:hypothetical protein
VYKFKSKCENINDISGELEVSIKREEGIGCMRPVIHGKAKGEKIL